MSLRLICAVWVGLYCFTSFAQELRFEAPQFNFDRGEYEIDVKPEEGHIDTQCRFLEFGELQNSFFDFALENDWISSDDHAYTHGLRFGLNFVGEEGKMRIGYISKLFTEEVELNLPSGTEPDDLRNFLEVTELRFDYNSRPNPDGFFYRAGVGVQHYTDQKTVWGARFQQEWLHETQERTGIGGSSSVDYQYGDTNEVSFIASIGAGTTQFTENRQLYCRAIADAELNTVFERSWIRGRIDGGVAICQDEQGLPILEIIGSFECQQYVKDLERDTTGSLMLRWNLPELPFGRGSFNLGVIQPFESSGAIHRYVDDDTLAVIGFDIRLGSSKRKRSRKY